MVHVHCAKSAYRPTRLQVTKWTTVYMTHKTNTHTI